MSHVEAPSRGSVWRASALALLLGLLLLALTSTPASAAVGHSVLRTFSTGPNTDPRAIATDSDGNVYVIEVAARRIDKFAAGGSRAAFSAGPVPYVGESSITGTPFGPLTIEGWTDVGLAVDRTGSGADGTIYAAYTDDTAAGDLLRFSPTGLLEARVYEPGHYFCGLALNQATGALYRNAGSGPLVRLPAPESNFAPDGTLNLPYVGANWCAVAANSAGAVYVGTQSGSVPVAKYEASQFGAESPVASAELPVLATALAVDPDSDNVIATDGSQITIFDAAGSAQGAPFGNLSNSHGLTSDPEGNILATDSGGGVFVYGPDEVQLPTATTGGSNNVTTDSAEVEGTVDPDGAGTITACQIRFGEDSGYSTGSAPCAPGGAISSPGSVSATLNGLVSGTTYHYRVFVTNANGTQMASSEQTFTTPIAIEGVTTEPASAVRKDGATLNGSYTGDGEEAHYFFEWGATSAYGHTTPASPGALAGYGSGPQTVDPVSVSGLHADTTYHYRLVVSDPDGVSRGEDSTFTTAAAVTDLTADPPPTSTDVSAELAASFEGDSTYDTSYYFEWGQTSSYGHVAPAPPGNVVPAGSGRIHVPTVTITGLEGGSVYHYRVVASNPTGTSVSADISFKTAEAPIIGNLSSRNVRATSAELAATVNPRYGQTSYHFEWGPTDAYGNSTPVPDGDVGSGSVPVPVSAQLEGLTSGVTYHFRVVATNQYGTAVSPDQTVGFYPPACPNSQLRQETRSNDLPDCRAYELVTPSFARGTSILPTAGPNTGLATNPARLTYGATLGTFSEDTGEPINSVADLYVSTRSATGWTQKYIGLPGSQTFLMGGPPETCQDVYWGVILTRLQDGTQASPQMDRIIDYNLGFPSYKFGQQGNISNAPYVWDSSSGQLLGRWPSNLAQTAGGEKFVGHPEASADFSHFVFSSNVVFAPGGEPADQEMKCPTIDGFGTWIPPSASVYDNDLATGQVVLASLKNEGGEEVPFQGSVYHVSTDGSHILMATEARPNYEASQDPVVPVYISGPLYLRVDGSHTFEIAAGRQIAYVGSTADGATVYLTSEEQLTADDHDSSADLFVWHESHPDSLTRVSVGSSGSAGDTDACSPASDWVSGCDVEVIDFTRYARPLEQGFGIPFVAGQGGNGFSDNFIASDSGDIYFESPEQLVGAKGEPGQANLYVYREGSVRFVATMKPGPFCTKVDYGGLFNIATGCTSGPVARMQVTPNGDHMAFVTNSQLTDYDNGEYTEMYLFDPDSGRVTCASCQPDDEPPAGQVLASQNGLFLTDDGRVFFSSPDPLVAKDTDKVEDVYEYTEGKPWLISSGIGTEGPGGFGGVGGLASVAGLVSVSANGTDAYFATRDTLVTQDHNGAQLKIYDARSGGGFPAERGESRCAAADECHGPLTSEAPPAPDRTSANLGKQAKPKARKHKKKHHGKHKKHRKKSAKKRKAASGAKQGRNHRG